MCTCEFPLILTKGSQFYILCKLASKIILDITMASFVILPVKTIALVSKNDFHWFTRRSIEITSHPALAASKEFTLFISSFNLLLY